MLSLSGRGIRLVDTRAHVTIRNVTILGWEGVAASGTCLAEEACAGAIGIDLVNSTHVRIEDVDIIGPRDGIRLLRSAHVTVHDTRIGNSTDRHGSENGVFIISSENVTVSRTVIAGINDKLDVISSGDVSVPDSHLEGRFSYIRLDDVALFRMSNSTLTDVRTVAQGTLDAVVLTGNRYERRASLLGPEFNQLRVGHIRICGNLVSDVGGTAIQLNVFDELHMLENRFEGGSSAFESMSGKTAHVHRNVFENQTWRGMALDADQVSMHHNVFANVPEVLILADSGDAAHNWWGEATGPDGAGPGAGTYVEVFGNVSITPWLTDRPEPFSTACRSTSLPPHEQATSRWDIGGP